LQLTMLRQSWSTFLPFNFVFFGITIFEFIASCDVLTQVCELI
jgi:hypothetical protein